MADTDKVERTEFLDKSMVAEISLWFLYTVFDNPDFEQRLRLVWKSCKREDEGAISFSVKALLISFETLDKLYTLFRIRELEEEAELEEDAPD